MEGVARVAPCTNWVNTGQRTFRLQADASHTHTCMSMTWGQTAVCLSCNRWKGVTLCPPPPNPALGLFSSVCAGCCEAGCYLLRCGVKLGATTSNRSDGSWQGLDGVCADWGDVCAMATLSLGLILKKPRVKLWSKVWVTVPQ